MFVQDVCFVVRMEKALNIYSYIPGQLQIYGICSFVFWVYIGLSLALLKSFWVAGRVGGKGLLKIDGRKSGIYRIAIFFQDFGNYR